MSKCFDGPLEELTELTGVMYLSDLKTTKYEVIRKELSNIDPNKYTLIQWKDTVAYLTGETIDFASNEDAYDFLLEY